MSRSARWYLLPLALLAGSLAAGGLSGALFWASFSHDPLPVFPGDRVTVSSSGLTLLSEVWDTAARDCTLAGEGRDVPIRPAGGRAVRLAAGAFATVGHTPLRTRAGTHTLECASGGEGLYAGHRIAYREAAIAGLASAVLFMAAFAGWVTLLVTRRRRRQDASPKGSGHPWVRGPPPPPAHTSG